MNFYGLKYAISDKYYKLTGFIRNAWRFRKELANFIDDDSLTSLSLFRRGLQIHLKTFQQYGHCDKNTIKTLQQLIKVTRRLENIDWLYCNILEKVCGNLRQLPENKHIEFFKKERELFERDKQKFIEIFKNNFFSFWL